MGREASEGRELTHVASPPPPTLSHLLVNCSQCRTAHTVCRELGRPDESANASSYFFWPKRGLVEVSLFPIYFNTTSHAGFQVLVPRTVS